jgi:hypothetical protein
MIFHEKYEQYNVQRNVLMKLLLLICTVVMFVDTNFVDALPKISLDKLSDNHPRLLFSNSDFASIRKTIAADEYLKKQLGVSIASGELLMDEAPDTYKLSGQEHTLLDVSRDMEGRILLLAGLYQLTGDSKFAQRATKEMLSAASFPDWYPTHFLDTAEMTTALGVGYDWLYATLSPTDRLIIHDAIVNKGITPWLSLQEAHAFHNDHNNWVQVCYGSEAIGALAIADRSSPDDLARARQVLDYAQPAMSRIMQLFAPDGGFEEGPVYWNYATTYNVLYIAALETSFGTDFGMSEEPGFSQTANYRIQSIGPIFDYANFGDAEPEAFPAPEMYWFAKRFQNPGFAAQERLLSAALSGHMSDQSYRESSRFAMLGLLWEALLPASFKTPSPPPFLGSFRRVAQAYMRSGWNDQEAWFVGFKGGDAHASHGHLDLGSFVLDAFGYRWAADLGKDNYGLPGYFKQQRWSYYRMSTEGHNTLTVEGQNEDLDAKAPLLQTGTTADSFFSVANLDQAYKGRLQLWKRGIQLIDRRSVLVQDDVTPAIPVDIVWNFHTAAAIYIASDGRSATLVQNGATLEARILSPANVRFDIVGTQAPPPQATNNGISNLIICLPKQASSTEIAVLFTGGGNTLSPKLMPLTAWRTAP